MGKSCRFSKSVLDKSVLEVYSADLNASNLANKLYCLTENLSDPKMT